jgi:hypothetical protein
MGEWKRVFLNGRRIGLFMLLAALCAGLFVLSLLDHAAPGAFDRMVLANRYAADLAEEWRDRPIEELSGLVQLQRERLQDIYFWYFGDDEMEYPFETEEEALAYIADVSGLARAVREHDNDGVYRTYLAHDEALDALQRQISHLDGYNEYLAEIQSRAELQSQVSIFGKQGSFSLRNLAQTAKDFETILDVEVEFGGSQGIVRWLDFELGDYFHLIAIIVIVLSFLEERRRGLWPAIRTTWGGRGRLGLTRAAILLAGSAAATLLYSVLPFLLSMALHGGWGDLTRSLQSVESFGTCPLRISILEWLVQFFAVKILAGTLIGLLLWCVLGSIANPQFSISVLGVTLAAEYALYTFLPIQSALNGLKYFNIFAYVHTATLYTQYLNVDLFGFAVGIRQLALWGIAVFGVLFAAWALLTQSRRRPEGNRDVLSRISVPMNRVLDIIRTRFTIGGWEGYKTLVFQYGVFLLALVYLAGGQLTYFYAVSEPIDQWYSDYINDMEGPVDSSTDSYLARARSSAERSGDAPQLLSALDQVEARVEVLRSRAEQGGYTPWIVNDFSYDIVYGPQSVSKQRFNGAVAVLLTALLAAPLWAFERQAGVAVMLRSTPRGRGRLLRRKAAMAALLAGFVWDCVYIRELWTFLDWLPNPDTLAASVQNIDALSVFPVTVTLGQYLALLYALRLLMLIGVAEAALAIGLFCPNVRTSYIASAAVLGFPALLAALGAEMFKWVSPVVPAASAELLWGLGSGSFLCLLPWVVWLFVVLALLFACHKKWVR